MTGSRLIRRGPEGDQEWQQPAAAAEPEEEAPRPTSRRVAFELPDGFMATISLVPYTEAVADVPNLADMVGPELPLPNESTG